VLVKSPYRVVPPYLLMPMYTPQLKLAVASKSDMALVSLLMSRSLPMRRGDGRLDIVDGRSKNPLGSDF
jgi:hypothetical protein